mgnify:CR=1 FL=1
MHTHNGVRHKQFIFYDRQLYLVIVLQMVSFIRDKRTRPFNMKFDLDHDIIAKQNRMGKIIEKANKHCN